MKDKMEDIRMVTFITTVLALIIALLIKFGLPALIVWGICMCFGLSFNILWVFLGIFLANCAIKILFS